MKGLGWRRDRLDHRDATFRYQMKAHIPVDETRLIDLRTLDAMKFPILDQGQTNSCVAHATARNVQYLLRAQGVLDFVPSRMFIYWNARAIIGETKKDEGCEIRDAFNVITDAGVPPEKEWPFHESFLFKRPTNRVFKDAMQHVALVRQSVPQKLDHLLSCLTHRLPVVFGASVFNFWDDPPAGIIKLPSQGDKPQGGHAILLTGWLPESKRFVFANSWGDTWGNDGYGTIPADYVLDPDLASDFWSCFLMSKGKK